MKTRQSFRRRHDFESFIPQVTFAEESQEHKREFARRGAPICGEMRMSLIADTTKIFFWTSTYVGW